MIALIDTIFNPVINWLSLLKNYLLQARITDSFGLSFSNVFAPITALSPSWAMVVSNVMVMIFIYGVLFIIHNGKDAFVSFVQAIKFW